jgi:3-hydroxyisobutyryl-CoA hydrolase
MRYTTQLLPSRSGNLGIITLNNPKALHALTIEMIYCLQDVLLQWCQSNISSSTTSKKDSSPLTASATSNSAMRAILFKSYYDPALPPKVFSFCAGGNVKDVYYSGKQQHLQEAKKGSTNAAEGPILIHDFFRQEYIVNHMLSQLNGSTCGHVTLEDGIPASKHRTQQQKLPLQISLWDGIVMGGGVGISIYGKYRIATERTVFAMPETAIGLFPDVGALFILPHLLRRCNTGLAPYLLLTGTRLFPHDVVLSGLATHYVPSDQLSSLERSLIDATAATDVSEQPLSDSMQDVIAPVLKEFHTVPPTPTSSILDLSSEIEQIFTIDRSTTMEAIVSALQQMASSAVSTSASTQFANQTLDQLYKMSPTSLKITLEGLKRSLDHSSLQEHLVMEYRMSQHCMKENSDFYEGIRATLIDKDNRPCWSPSILSEVTEGYISSFFQPIESEWELPEKYNMLMLESEAAPSESRL